jgi:hypothetical protein
LQAFFDPVLGSRVAGAGRGKQPTKHESPCEERQPLPPNAPRAHRAGGTAFRTRESGVADGVNLSCGILIMAASQLVCWKMPLFSALPSHSEATMRFYNQQHRFYAGIDLHARSMYLCILDPCALLQPAAATGRESNRRGLGAKWSGAFAERAFQQKSPAAPPFSLRALDGGGHRAVRPGLPLDSTPNPFSLLLTADGETTNAMPAVFDHYDSSL